LQAPSSLRISFHAFFFPAFLSAKSWREREGERGRERRWWLALGNARVSASGGVDDGFRLCVAGLTTVPSDGATPWRRMCGGGGISRCFGRGRPVSWQFRGSRSRIEGWHCRGAEQVAVEVLFLVSVEVAKWHACVRLVLRISRMRVLVYDRRGELKKGAVMRIFS
jgi:hypothetical protein